MHIFRRPVLAIGLIVVTSILVGGCSDHAPTDAGGPVLQGLKCRAIESQGEYVIAPPVPPARPPNIYPTETLNRALSEREAELFRHIAFKGSDDSILFPPAARRWDDTVVAFIVGSQPFVDIAGKAITVAAGIAGLELEITDDPKRANFTACVGINYQHYAGTLEAYEVDPWTIEAASWGVGLMNPPDTSSLTALIILTTLTDDSDPQISFERQRAIVWEEIVQGFGLIRDFALSEFGDVPGASTSLFVEGIPKVHATINEFDARYLYYLYAYVRSGMFWDQAHGELLVRGLLE